MHEFSLSWGNTTRPAQTQRNTLRTQSALRFSADSRTGLLFSSDVWEGKKPARYISTKKCDSILASDCHLFAREQNHTKTAGCFFLTLLSGEARNHSFWCKLWNNIFALCSYMSHHWCVWLCVFVTWMSTLKKNLSHHACSVNTAWSSLFYV